MPKARYKHLVDSLVADIRSGKLSPGTRLPTHRQLATREGIALVTASRVYTELEVMGLVSGETGRGTFVRESELPPGHGIDQPGQAEGLIDLNFNSPTLPGQTDLLREGLRHLAASGGLETLLHYQPHAGRRHERLIVAKHLSRRGLSVDAEQVVIVSGAQHGLAATVMTLLNPGDVVTCDALIYPGFKILADVHRLELVSIPVSKHGPNLDALDQLCQTRRVRAVYTMPTLHNPLGWVIGLSRRKRLVAIARQCDLLLIEDAAYAFLAENPPPPLTALAPERSVHISGISKSVATGLRIGFVVAPADWVSQFERTIRATTWNTPGVVTSIACRWIEDGTVARLETEKRHDASRRQLIAEEVLTGLNTIGHSSSYFIWLTLPEEVRADTVAMDLTRDNISVSTAEPFAITEHVPHALSIALASVSMETLKPALVKVREVIGRYWF